MSQTPRNNGMKRNDDTTDFLVHLANDRDRVVGAFCGEPLVKHVHWVDGRSETCLGAGCGWCKQGRRRSFRATMNFYVPAKREMKIIQGGERWFRDVLKLREKYGLDRWLYEVERHGGFGDSKTYYSILPERPIDPFVRAEMDATELHDLRKVPRSESSNELPKRRRTNGEAARLQLVNVN